MNVRRILSIAAVALFAGSSMVLRAATPLLKVPYVAPETAAALMQDGSADGQWSNAAVVEHFNNVGNSAVIPVPTRVQIFHDGKNILIRAHLTEAKPFFAHERLWQETFVGDSAFRFALGAGSLGVSDSTIAGYDSPYSSRQDLRHFYEYTINAAGSKSRCYNECPVREPLFDGQVSTVADGWQVLMKVPLASAGITWSKGAIYYCNFNRFYQGARYGWVLGGYGGYTALQFGLMELLPAERNAEKSCYAAKKMPSKKRNVISRVSAARLTYYPLAGKVTAEVPTAARGSIAKLVVADNSIEIKAEEGESGIGSVPVTLPAGAGFNAKLTLNGRLLASENYTVPEKPEWLGTKAGIQYLNDTVPFPWKNVECRDGIVKLAHAEWNFGEKVLPQQISVKGQELLAAPIYISAVAADGKSIAVTDDSAGVTVRPVAVESVPVESSGSIQVKSRVEFDGFSVIRLRASGLGGTAWRKLAIHIPMKPGICQFINFGFSQELLRIGQGGYQGNPSNFWTGNGNVGLAFSYDRNCFPNGTEAPRVEIRNEEIVILLADSGSGSFSSEYVWQFFLQPTPVRGDFIPPFSNTMSTGAFERWSDYQGYPDLAKIPAVKQAVKTTHDKGSKLYVYFSNILAENSPGFTDYRADLEALPKRMWYKRAYNPGKGVQCFVTCLRKERGEQMLHGVQKLLDECGIDGVYLDGPTVAFSCDNPGHDCRDSLPAAWNDDYMSGRILGHRAFLKRLRGIFDAKGIKYPLWSHTGGEIFTSTLCMADYYYDGEQLSRFRDGYLVEPEKFRINFALQGLGIRGRLLPILYFDSTWTSRQSLPLALVHATETSALKEYHPLEKFFFSFLRRQNPARFYPYWEEQPHWRVEADETIFASYLRSDTEGVLVISNLYQDGEKQVSINLDKFFGDNKFTIKCLTNPDTAFDRQGNSVTFTLKPFTMKMFYVTTNAKLPADLPSPARKAGTGNAAEAVNTKRGFNSDEWRFSTGILQPDGSLDFAAAKKSAFVSFKKALPEPFTMRFTLEHSGPFNIFIDDVKISYTNSTGWLIEGIDEFENEDYCATSHKGHRGGHEALNRPVEVVISMEKDHLNVAYDGARLLHNALPAVDNASHTVKISAPAGSKVKLSKPEVENSGAVPFSDFELMHPVLKL